MANPLRYLALCLAALGCSAGPPPPLAKDLSGIGSGPFSFESTDAYDFVDMLAPPSGVRQIPAEFLLPPGDGPVRGAVIMSHGSAGTGGRQDRMADALVEAGYAALIIDHFTPRDIGSTVRDQLRVTAQGMLVDVFAARDLLASHPRIPDDRIGVIGWSKGGIVASLAAVDRFAGYADRGSDRMAFAIAFYPYCGFDLDAETLASPLLYLIGSEDDWTPPAPCVRQANAWAAQDQPAEIIVYPGAEHGFDAKSFSINIPWAVTIRDTSDRCTLRVDADGRTVTLDGTMGVDTLERRQAFVAACGVRGVGFGGNASAREDAIAQVKAFLERTLTR